MPEGAGAASRAQNGDFTLKGVALEAIEDLKAEQSTALRFAEHCLEVTGKPADVVPLKLAFRAYAEWAHLEERLSPGKVRDKTGFKDDVLAAGLTSLYPPHSARMAATSKCMAWKSKSRSKGKR